MSKSILAMSLLATFALAGPVSADEATLERGKAVYDTWCGICHGDDDKTSGGGTSALQFLYKGTKPAKLEDRTDLTPEFITVLVRKGRMSMPNFRLTEISEADLDAVIAYLTRNNDQSNDLNDDLNDDKGGEE